VVSITDIPREKLTFPQYQNASAIMDYYGLWIMDVISRQGRLPLVFIDRGVKNNAEYYKTEVLERILRPEAQN
jgi:hypothetical protein